jgi:hypoxanthine phosphoribosyltransferase
VAALNSSSPPKEILEHIARSCANALSVAGCSILLLNSRKNHLLHVSSHGLGDWYLRKGFIEADKSLPEMLRGDVVEVIDASQDLRLQFRELAEQAGIASILSVPLKQNNETIGALRVYTHRRRIFSKRDKEFASRMADLSALVLRQIQSVELTTKPAENQEFKSLELKKLVTFAHPSEEQFARLLDFYDIKWLYEPRSFPLQWQDNHIGEMFTPDFYLPELNLYVELTTLKQSLVREKNQKIRRLKELYPEVEIKLLTRKDYSNLLAKYGCGPLAGAKAEGVARVLFGDTQIEEKVMELGKHISNDYAGHSLLLVGVLKGVFCFMADLMRHISIPVAVDFLGISYYADASSGVSITRDLDQSIKGKDVLMVEDIVDTGMTLNYILNYLGTREPASLKVCALLDKRVRRLVQVPLDYVGFEIGDEFVVGYGLDYQGEYRNLPFIGVLHPTTSVPQMAQETKNPE